MRANRDLSPIDTRAAAPVTEISLVLCAPRKVETHDREFKIADFSLPGRLDSAPVAARDSAVLTSSTAQVTPSQKAPDLSGTGTPLPHSPSGISGTGDSTTTFFEITTRGKAIVYVIDRSASMGLNGGLAKAKQELLTSLDRLPPTSRFQIIAYNRSAEPLRINGESGLVFASPENKRRAAIMLQDMEAEGGTEHLTALRRALELRPDVVFFLTDADDLRADHIRGITSLNHGRTVIHAIGLGRPPAVSGDISLYALAQNNGGRYKSVPLGP